MREAFKKIEGVVDDIGLGTLTFPLEEKVSNYVFIFYQIADVLQHLPAYLKKNHPGLLPEPDRRFRHQLATRGISVADNTENLVRGDAEQVANRMTTDHEDGLRGIEEDPDDGE
jgi:hypothetical protein